MNTPTAAVPKTAHNRVAAAAEQILEETVGRLGIEEVLRATEERASLASVVEHAKIGFRSKYLPKYVENEDQAIAIALAGHELGIPPMTAFRAIYFFDGRIVLSAQLLVVLARRRVPGFNIDFVKTNETGCWILVSRPGMTEPAKIAFTLEDATRANLTGKNNWKNYPAAMCIARACAMAVRAVAPEAGIGITTQEEKDDGLRFEVELGPEGVTVGAPAKTAVEGLKQDLASRQAERAAPPPGFDAKDPTPPPGFSKPKAKRGAAAAKEAPPGPASSPATATKELPDASKFKVGDTTADDDGVVWECIDAGGANAWQKQVATAEANARDDREPGSDG